MLHVHLQGPGSVVKTTRYILGPLTYSFPGGENIILITRNQYGILSIKK
jgi:hypothetical protein